MKSWVRKSMMSANRRAQAGMTLIEIMVVVMIMGLIMASVGYAVFRWYRRAQKKTTMTTIDSVVKALWMWRQEEKEKASGGERCPSSLDVLVPEYIKNKRSLRDSWGNALKFRCGTENFCVWSMGPNEKDDGGGGDDLKSDGCSESGEE